MDRSQKSRKTVKFAVLAVAALALAACTPQSTPTAEPTPTQRFVTAPLTGVQYAEGSDQANNLSRPSVACKIDNSDAARPQLGLNRTDIVFDEMVEGGLTRFVAIWHSDQPSAVGPVRSIRPMDPDILSSFGGIVCYSGGQTVFMNMMKATNVFNASETSEQGQGTFSRTKDRIAPHNVIVDVAKLASNHLELPAPATQFEFAANLADSSAAKSGTEVSDIKVYFPAALAQWTPSPDSSVFLRTQDTKVDTDAADGSQLHTVNVVIMTVTVDRSYKDRRYGNVPKDNVIGTGQAQVCSAGKCMNATWSKADRMSPIVLTDASGAKVLLAPGNTWVELQPAGPEGKTVLTQKSTPSPTATTKG
jgi:hypothetical protein